MTNVFPNTETDVEGLTLPGGQSGRRIPSLFLSRCENYQSCPSDTARAGKAWRGLGPSAGKLMLKFEP